MSEQFEYKAFFCDSYYKNDLLGMLYEEGNLGWECVQIVFMQTPLGEQPRYAMMKRKKGWMES